MTNEYIHLLSRENRICEQIQQYGHSCGYKVLSARTLNGSVDILKQYDPQAIIIDQDHPAHDKLLNTLASNNSSTAVILLHSQHQFTCSQMAIGRCEQLNLLGTLEKPIILDALADKLYHIEKSRGALTKEQFLVALQDNQFELFYQPVVALKSQQIIGAEALIRWRHPQHGILIPAHILPFAEKAHLMMDLSYWTFKHCFAQVAAWNKERVNLECSLNLSDSILAEADLPYHLNELALQQGIQPQKIALDISENIAITQYQRFEKTLAHLKKYGFQLVIDGFGNAKVSLPELVKLPFDTIKMDKAFALRVDSDPEAEQMLKAMINLAHDLDFKTSTAGLETAEAWQLLTELGCDTGQGYYISQPVSVKDFNQWLRVT